MTKKDYELIASVIKGRMDNAIESYHFGYSDKDIQHATNTLADLADFMAYELSQDNPRFDRQRFLQACGIKIEQ